jgi:hypothetical protein
MDYTQEHQKLPPEIIDLKLPKPTLRALINADIYTLKKLRSMSVIDLKTLHGMGPSSIQNVLTLLADK